MLVHAISKEGLLTVENTDGPICGDLPANVEYETCEWVFPANSRKDYHLQMNSERFMNWVRYLCHFIRFVSLHI